MSDFAINQKKQNYIVFRKDAKFKPSRQLQRKLQKPQKWVLDMGKYKQQNCKQMFRDAIEAGVHRMWIGFNENSNILIQISQTLFTNLAELWLTKDLLESIEIISRIYIPNLQQIHLRQNYLINFKPMRRCNWPKIQVINIYGNKAPQLSCLTQLNAPKLNTFWTEYQVKDRAQPQDLRWMAKLMSNNLNSICIASDNRIKQQEFMKTMKNKSNKSQQIFHLYDN